MKEVEYLPPCTYWLFLFFFVSKLTATSQTALLVLLGSWSFVSICNSEFSIKGTSFYLSFVLYFKNSWPFVFVPGYFLLCRN